MTLDLNKLNYLSVQILKMEVTNDSNSPLQKGDDFELDYIFNATHLYNKDKELVRVIILIEIKVSKNRAPLNAGAKFQVDNYFHYQGLNLFAKEENNQMLVDAQFADAVKGIAFSNSRGIVFSKLSGTFLEGTLLPIKMSTDIW